MKKLPHIVSTLNQYKISFYLKDNNKSTLWPSAHSQIHRKHYIYIYKWYEASANKSVSSRKAMQAILFVWLHSHSTQNHRAKQC